MKFPITFLLFFLFIHLTICAEEEIKAKDSNKIVLITIQKSGTHLLNKTLILLTGKRVKPIFFSDSYNDSYAFNAPSNNRSYGSHAIYNPAHEHFLIDNNCAVFFVYRDPRDQIISSFFWMKKSLDFWPWMANIEMDEFISYMISDGNYFNISKYYSIFNLPKKNSYLDFHGIADVYNSYIPWKNIPGICNIRFEDLIGERGGGNNLKQDETIQNICHHVGIQLTPNLLNHVKTSLFGGTWTFREGQIGSWKKHFTEEHKKVFKEIAGQLLIDLNYESDLNW